MFRNRRYIQVKQSSHTLDSVLGYIYRKQHLLDRCGKYATTVIEGLVDLKLVKKVLSKKGTFYFKTEKSENFKAVDFAEAFLWAYHNPLDRTTQNNKKLILCFDKDIEAGHGLVEIGDAIKKGFV